jgi:poly-gamma-glutamate synthesis protein (capsule biosynthesis protein)
VDILQMANSWSIHNGINGLVSTLQTIRESGIEPVGAYGTRDEFRKSGGYTIRDVNGVKVGIVAFTKGMNSMALPTGSENCVNLLYSDYSSNYQTVDTKGITQILENVQEERPDITVAMLHWGSEVNDQISSTQKRIVNLMFSAGVDVIIGTHPHYVQSILFDEDAGTFIAYSLGDFFGDATEPGTEYSIILDLEITKDNETGVTKVTGYDYTPIFTVHEEGKPLRVVRIREAMAAYNDNYVDKVSDLTFHDMEYALGRIDARVNTPVK